MTVLLFAAARDRVGQSRVDVELPPGSTVATLKAELPAQHPELAGIAAKAVVAVDQEYVRDDMALRPDQEIALIPPVSGG